MTKLKSGTLNLGGVAHRLNIKRRTLYDMIKDGRFNVRPIKGTKPRLWNIEDIDAWLKSK